MTPLKGIRMFRKKTDAETSSLEDVKNAILTQLGNEEPGTTRYEVLIAELERVCELMKANPKWTFKPSADGVLNGVLTIASILLITRHEQVHVITSKALSFLPKLIR
jgi:hypothetical protein